MPIQTLKPPFPPERALVQKFEDGIRSLIMKFREHPYAFYTESDLHCYLYHRLYQGGILNGLCITSQGKRTMLLHKEYPTKARYSRNADKHLVNDPSGRRRGAFDIVVWDPNLVSKNSYRHQVVLCAAELALNECGPSSVHSINDHTKLSDPENDVKHGYLLFFVRDSGAFEKNKSKVISDLNTACSKNTNVVLVHVGKKKLEFGDHTPKFKVNRL